MIRPINTGKNPILFNLCIPCAPVLREGGLTGAVLNEDTALWTPIVREIIQDLIETAESLADECLGLAAPQIWWEKDEPCPAVFILRWPVEPIGHPRGWDWKTIINPTIYGTGRSFKATEGCLSRPDITMNKRRHKNVTIIFQSVDNQEYAALKVLDSMGPYARIIQHEFDHLRGKLIKK